MDKQNMIGIIEGLLLVSEEPLDIKTLEYVLGIEKSEVELLIEKLENELLNPNRGLIIKRVAGGLKMTTKPELYPYIIKLMGGPKKYTLSQQSLETLSIIAVKQPITKGEIESIRGVTVDKSIATLLSKNLIREVGRLGTAGRPILYGTTKYFLEYFGLNSLDELEKMHSKE